jgi:hypothetical protein
MAKHHHITKEIQKIAAPHLERGVIGPCGRQDRTAAALPQGDTAEIRRQHPVVVFVMKELRTIIMSVAVLLIGGGGAVINHRNQANDTEWIGQHLHQKASAADITYLQSEIDDLRKELKQNLPTDSDAVGFVPRGGAVVALEPHKLPVAGSIPAPAILKYELDQPE